MEVMNAVLPNMPTGTPSSPSAIAGAPGGVALGTAPSQGTASAVGAGIETAVPGVAINSAAAGLLFGMVLTQMIAGKDALGKDAKESAGKVEQARDASETPTQLSPDQISMLASIAPLLVTLQVGPEPIAATTGTSVAVPNVGMPASPLVQTSLATLPAISLATQSVLSTDAGKNLKVASLSTPGPITAEVLPAAPQMPVAPMIATPASTMALTQDEKQIFQTMLKSTPAAGEPKNQDGPAMAANTDADSLHAVPTTIAKNDQISDQSQSAQSPSIVVGAMLTGKKEEKDLSQAVSGESARMPDLSPEGNGRIPAEFLAASEPSHNAPTDAAAIAPKAVVMPDAAPSSITPRETISLQLGPSDMGRLTLQVSVQSQQVQATVGVEHRGLGEFLAASQGLLDDAMRQHGLRLEELHIESIGNSDVLGAGTDRAGFLDHGQARQDTSGFERAPLARQVPESEAVMMKDNVSDAGSRYRINLFA
jgi:hypothetical protein